MTAQREGREEKSLKGADMEDAQTRVREPGVPESFVGIREDIRKVRAATAAALEGMLTAEQTEAASLVAELLDSALAGGVLDLPPGTVERWAEDPRFVKKAATDRYHSKWSQRPTKDFGRVLSPKQRAAARLLSLEFKSQTEVAVAVGVDPRTIRNWLRQPEFRRYQEQIEREAEAQASYERAARQRAFEDRLGEERIKALNVMAKAIEEGDLKAALDLLRVSRRLPG
jgi:hypothetical protein